VAAPLKNEIVFRNVTLYLVEAAIGSPILRTLKWTEFVVCARSFSSRRFSPAHSFSGGASGLTPQPPMTVYGNAPIGHLQPHARNFSPGSAAEQTEQDRMSNFDAEQHKMDEELDKSLNICRC